MEPETLSWNCLFPNTKYTNVPAYVLSLLFSSWQREMGVHFPVSGPTNLNPTPFYIIKIIIRYIIFSILNIQPLFMFIWHFHCENTTQQATINNPIFWPHILLFFPLSFTNKLLELSTLTISICLSYWLTLNALGLASVLCTHTESALIFHQFYSSNKLRIAAVMVHPMCQPDWDIGCPDNWSKLFWTFLWGCFVWD